MDREQPLTLQYQERDGIALPAVLDQARGLRGLAGAVCFLSSAAWFRLAVLGGDGELRDVTGQTPPLGGVFEARLFSPVHELRWTLTADGARAVLLTEHAATALPGWAEPVPLAVERLPEHTYLLMGTRDGPATLGWTRLVAGRTRAIDVPLETAAQRVALRAVEYARRDAEHGNVHVCEERLLRLEPAPSPPHGSEP